MDREPSTPGTEIVFDPTRSPRLDPVLIRRAQLAAVEDFLAKCDGRPSAEDILAFAEAYAAQRR